MIYVLLRTGALGVGNMGNMVAALANNSQMPVLGMNTSERDIDAVKSSTQIECLYIGTGDGAGKDRTKSKDALKASIKNFMGDDKFKSFMDACDVVFIVSSTGGGTGSGTCPMLADILKNFYKDKHFIVVGALPTIGESIGAQRNTVEYITEVVRLGLPYMLFDNGNSGTKATNDTFDKINEDVVEAMRVIRGDYNQLSKYGMIDRGDMEKLIELPGMIHINVLKGIYQEKIPSDGSIEDLIIDSMKQNTMVTLDRDKIVKRRGYIVNISEDIRSYFDTNLPKLTELYGEALEVFDHYRVNEDEDERANYVVTIQSGLSLPENRLKMIQHRIQESEEALRKQKESTLLDSLAERVTEYDSTTSRNKKPDDGEFDLDSLLNKY